MSRQLLALQRLLRKMQQVNRFFEEDYYTGLPAAQSLILIEIDSVPLITAKDLSEVFGLDKSTISRCIASLLKQRLIVRSPSPEDSRQQIFKVTPKGQAVLLKNDTESNATVAHNLKHFSVTESDELASYFRKMCDGLSIPAGVKRARDSDLRVGIRRYTKGFGLVGATFLSSGLPPSQWYALEEIFWSTRPLTAVALGARLRTSSTSMSQVMASLEKKRLISRNPSALDARELLLSVTSKGKELIAKVESDAGLILKRGCKDFTVKELARFILLLRRYLGEPEVGPVLIDNSFELVQVSSDSDRRAARAFLVSQSVARQLETSLPERIIALGNETYILKNQNKIVGVIEYSPTDTETISAYNFIIEKGLPHSICNRFISSSAICALKELGAKRTEISPVLFEKSSEPRTSTIMRANKSTSLDPNGLRALL